MSVLVERQLIPEPATITTIGMPLAGVAGSASVPWMTNPSRENAWADSTTVAGVGSSTICGIGADCALRPGAKGPIKAKTAEAMMAAMMRSSGSHLPLAFPI